MLIHIYIYGRKEKKKERYICFSNTAHNHSYIPSFRIDRAAQYTTPVQHRSERFRSRLSISPHEYEEIQFFSASSPAVPTTTPPASVQKVKVSPAKCPFTPSAVQNFPGLDEWLQAIPPKKSKKVKKKTKTEKIDNNNNSSEGGLKHTSDSVTYLTEAPRAPSPKWQPRRRTTGMDRTDGGAVGGTAASLSDNVEMLSMSNHNEEEEEEEDAETDGEDEEDEADYEEDGEFRWSIDDLAQLMPVDIEVKNKKLSRPLPSALSPFLFVHLLIGGKQLVFTRQAEDNLHV